MSLSDIKNSSALPLMNAGAVGEATAPGATFSSTVVNLTKTILGTGILLLPTAMAGAGIVPGLILLIVSAFLGGSGLYFLGTVGSIVGRNAKTVGSKWPTILFDSAIVVKCIGVAVAYLIAIGNYMKLFVMDIYLANNSAIEIKDFAAINRMIYVGAFTALLLPLIFFRKLDSLKYTSYVGLFGIVYMIFVSIFVAIVMKSEELVFETQIVCSSFVNFIKSYPLFIFAFTCHQNMIPLQNELKDNSMKNTTRIIIASICIATGLYLVFMLVSYFTFGVHLTRGLDMLNFYADPISSGTVVVGSWKAVNYIVNIGRLLFVILLACSYPLQSFPCRAALTRIVGTFVKKETMDSINRPFYVIVTLFIATVTFLPALFVDKLGTAMTIVSSTGSVLLGYILPAYLYYDNTRKEGWTRKRYCALALAVVGLICMGLGLASVAFEWDKVWLRR